MTGLSLRILERTLAASVDCVTCPSAPAVTCRNHQGAATCMRRVPARQIRRGADRSNPPATPAADGRDRPRPLPSARFAAAMLIAIRLDSCRAVSEYRASDSAVAPLALLVCRQIGPPGSTGVMQSDHLQVQRTVRPQAHPKLALASPTQAGSLRRSLASTRSPYSWNG